MSEAVQIANLKEEVNLQDRIISHLQGDNLLLREDVKDLNANLEAAIELLDELNPQMSLTFPASNDFGGCE